MQHTRSRKTTVAMNQDNTISGFGCGSSSKPVKVRSYNTFAWYGRVQSDTTVFQCQACGRTTTSKEKGKLSNVYCTCRFCNTVFYNCNTPVDWYNGLVAVEYTVYGYQQPDTGMSDIVLLNGFDVSNEYITYKAFSGMVDAVLIAACGHDKLLSDFELTVLRNDLEIEAAASIEVCRKNIGLNFESVTLAVAQRKLVGDFLKLIVLSHKLPNITASEAFTHINRKSPTKHLLKYDEKQNTWSQVNATPVAQKKDNT